MKASRAATRTIAQERAAATVVSPSGTTPPTLTYDPQGRLWESAAGTGATRYAYEGTKALTQQDTTGTYWRRYVHGPGAIEPLVQYQDQGAVTRRFLAIDERGSVIAQSNDSGTATAINRYDEYGIAQSGNAGTFGYAGMIPGGAINYDKARYYRSGEGIFAQPDPIGYSGDGPNLYAYVLNDPVNLVDPAGLGNAPIVVTAQAPIVVTGTRPCANGKVRINGFCEAAPGTGGDPGRGGARDEIIVVGRRGHYYYIRTRLCTPGHGVQCHIDRANSEICVLPGHISTDPIVSGDWYAAYASYADLWPGGFVTTVQTGQHSFRNTTTWLHPLSGTVDRIFVQVPGGAVDVITIGQGTAATAFQDRINKARGPSIFKQQDDLCAAVIRGQ